MKGLLISVGRRGTYYVDPEGHIIRRDGMAVPSSTWTFLGVSKHPLQGHPSVSFAEIFQNPELAVGGLVWDQDHGTTRKWEGDRVTRCILAGIPSCLLVGAWPQEIPGL